MTKENELDDYENLASNFVGAIQSSTRFEEIVALCTAYYATNGVIMSSYHHMPPVGALDHTLSITVHAQGFPNDWVQKYRKEELYKIDPIPKLAILKTEPFWWSQESEFPNLTPDEQKYLRMLASADFGDGLAVPVFGPNGRNGYVGLGFGKGHGPDNVSRLKASRLQSASQIGHQRYCLLLAANSDVDVHLSDREREILVWIVRGKSNSVIADIIGISSYTVDTYLRRIFAKLGVSSRVTAALRGIALGVI